MARTVGQFLRDAKKVPAYKWWLVFIIILFPILLLIGFATEHYWLGWAAVGSTLVSTTIILRLNGHPWS